MSQESIFSYYLALIFLIIIFLFNAILLQEYSRLFFQNIKKEQDRVFNKMNANYEKTQFGEDHQIRSKMSYSLFQKQVPISSYDNLKKYLEIDRQKFNKQILSKKPIIWEKTSGSSSKSDGFTSDVNRTYLTS